MENAGAIVYNDGYIFQDEVTIYSWFNMAHVFAHEVRYNASSATCGLETW